MTPQPQYIITKEDYDQIYCIQYPLTSEERRRICERSRPAPNPEEANPWCYPGCILVDRAKKEAATCAWILDEEYQMYETGCGNAFECMVGDIEENNFKFCPYCGGKIVGGTP